MEHISVEVVAVGALLVLASVYLYSSSGAQYSKLPPGPRPVPFLGNKVPSLYPWRYFEQLTREYGDLCTVWIGRKPMVVVGSMRAATDILERMGGQTASRPPNYYASDIVSGNMRILLIPYGDRWRRLRKAIHSNLQPSVAATFEPIQEKAAQNVLKDIVKDPDHHQEHSERYAASVILNVAYGKPTATDHSDPQIQEVNLGAGRLGSVVKPTDLWISYLPFLKYVPWYLKQGKQWHSEELSLFSGQLDGVRQKMAKNECDPCFGSHIVEHQKEYGLNNSEAAYIAGSLFGAGSDTSASAITIGVMAAVMFPRCQALVQEELDRVVGRSRPPNFDDWDDLPYTSAFCKEIFRWRPVSSGGFAHATNQEVHYDGYIIPEGTAIIGNHWAIHRDPKVFPEPDEFRPERWLEPKNDANSAWKPSKDKSLRHYTFGFGRRVCPGLHVAERSVYINTALLHWAFLMQKKLDANGKEIDIDTLAFSNSANSHPLPGMPVKFVPRFEGVIDQVKKLEGWA